MHNQIVKIKPQLIRKRIKVDTRNVSIVVKPSQAQILNLKDIQKTPKTVSIPLPKPPAQPILPAAAVARPRLKNKRTIPKKPNVQHISRDVSPESIAKIAIIKNVGIGKLLLIIGNGPSILEADLPKLTNNPRIDILSVNKPDSRLWPTKYWAFFDTSQFRRHENLWDHYTGTIFNSTAIKRQKATSMQFKNINSGGWSRDLLQGITIGRSSVFASMQIGAWMNYEHVYIFGCDMNPDGINGQLHFYGQNPDANPEDRKRRFEVEAKYYDRAADIMTEQERSRFTFCSLYNYHAFVKKFNKLDHTIAAEHILKHADQLANVL